MVGLGVTAPLSTYDSATAELVRRQLASVLESPQFVVPERARRFLSYIVEESLAGRADRIKAFSIATDVLGRGSSFDGSVDPVVRIEAGRVRRALEHYYLVAGADDPIIITIPKGGYVPIFTRRDTNGSSDQASVDEKQWRNWHRLAWLLPLVVGLIGAGLIAGRLPALEAVSSTQTLSLSRLLVSPFTFDGGAAHSADIAQGLTEEVVRQLASFREIEVVAGPQPTSSGMADPVQYQLQGALRVIDGRYRLSVRLIDIADGFGGLGGELRRGSRPCQAPGQ